MRLSAKHKNILQALLNGDTLKLHRHLDGTKEYRLRALDGTTRRVSQSTIEKLERAGHIISNQKFPTATYLLTEKGKPQVKTDDEKASPLTAHPSS